MGAGMLAGSLLVAYGPAVAFLLTYVWWESALLILAVASAFSAYVWTLLTSLVWLAVPPIKTAHVFALLVNPLLAEAVRGAALVGYTRVERLADRTTSPSQPKVFVDLPAAIAMGLGSGLMVTIMRYGAALGSAGGRQAWYYPSCPALSAYVLNAFSALLTNGLHVALTVLLLDALRRKSWPRAGGALAIHAAFSAAGALVQAQGGCVAVLPIQGVLLCGAVYAAVRAVASPDYSARRQVRAWALLRERQAAQQHGEVGEGRQR